MLLRAEDCFKFLYRIKIFAIGQGNTNTRERNTICDGLQNFTRTFVGEFGFHCEWQTPHSQRAWLQEGPNSIIKMLPITLEDF